MGSKQSQPFCSGRGNEKSSNNGNDTDLICGANGKMQPFCPQDYPASAD